MRVTGDVSGITVDLPSITSAVGMTTTALQSSCRHRQAV
jgi:hypothetical protein